MRPSFADKKDWVCYCPCGQVNVCRMLGMPGLLNWLAPAYCMGCERVSLQSTFKMKPSAKALISVDGGP